MPDRWGMTPNSNQKSTDYFIMQITSGDPNLDSSLILGQQMFSSNCAGKSNHEELNSYKSAISKANNISLSKTSMRFVDVYKDSENTLFYFQRTSTGYVKTILGTKPDAKAMFKAFFRM